MAGIKIWPLTYSGRRTIHGTPFQGGTRSNLAVCSINTSGYSTMCPVTATAIVAFLEGNVSFGRSVYGWYHVEAKSHWKKDQKYVIRFDVAQKKLEAFAAENGVWQPANLISAKYIHWSIFAPRIAMLLAENPTGEFARCFKEVAENLRQRGKITQDDEDNFYIMCDFLYETRHEYIMTDDEITLNSSATQILLKEDLTKKVLGRTPEYEYAVLSTMQPSSWAPTQSEIPREQEKAKAEEKKEIPYVSLERYRLPIGELSEDDRALVPNFDLSKMKFPEWLVSFLEIVKGEYDGANPIKAAIFYGEGGTGKSTACKLAAQVLGLPYSGENFSHGFEESNLIGMYRPNESGFDFYTPKFAQRFERGGIYEAAEFNFAKPGALGVLNSALDDSAILTLGNGRTIRRHKNFIMIATLNVDYHGTQLLNQALKDRFQLMIHVPKPSRQDMVDIIKWRSGLADERLINKIIDAGEAIAAEMEEQGEFDDGICSLRQWIGWAQATKRLGSAIAAAYLTILPGVSLDRRVQDDICDRFLKTRFA